MAKLLIAGYGFLGAALKREFSAAGWEVTTLSRSSSADISCDLTSVHQVQAISGVYDLVIQCAASGGGGEDVYRAVYLDAARNLLAKFGGENLIFISSTSVYPQTDDTIVTERSLAEPVTATGRILKQTEDEVLAAGGSVARLSGLYGPARCHVLKGILGGTARLDGEGRRVMNFIHRDDAASAIRIIAAPTTPPAVYNVSAGAVTQRECYQSLVDHFSLPLPPVSDGEVPRKRGNNSKIVSNELMKSLGWEPMYPSFLLMALATQK